MPIPPKIDELIRRRFENLIDECAELETQANKNTTAMSPRGIPSGLTRDKVQLSGSKFEEIRTGFLSVLQILSNNTNYIATVMNSVRELQNTPSGVDSLIGKIKATKTDYEEGMFISLVEFIEAEVAADYLGQAVTLLGEGRPGKFDHVPSAVLLGAVLEDALKRLCQRQTPPINLTKANGKLKTLNPLIDDLKQVGLYNELKAKQLRAWADIRNSAAHGDFTAFTRSDVEQMLEGISSFLSDYM